MHIDSVLLPAARHGQPPAEALVRSVAHACAAPMVILAAWRNDVLHVQACCGFRRVEVPDRALATCRATRHETNPVVHDTAEGHFAGIAIRTATGEAIGVLAYWRPQPTRPDDPSLVTLKMLGDVAVALLDVPTIAANGASSLPAEPDRMRTRLLADVAAREARFRAISDASPHGVFFADAEGKCAYMNRRCREIVGMGSVIQQPMTWFEPVHPEDSPGVQDEWMRATTEHLPFDMSCRLRCEDGTVRRVQVRAQAMFGAAGTVEGFVGSIEDITGQERTLARLSASEKRLRHLYEATPALMQSLDPHGRVLTVSDAWLARFGYAREDVIGRHAAEFLTPESKAQTRANLLPVVLETGGCDDVEIKMITRDGAILDVLLSAIMERKPDGSALRSLVVFDDITQRKQVERALYLERERTERANERFALAARSGGIGVWEFDVAARAFRFDEQIARLYGMPPGTFESQYDDFVKVLHPDDRDVMERNFNQAIAGGPPIDTEFRIRWPDASIHHVRAAGRIERGAADEPVRMVGVNWDVTELRSLALELAEEHELLRVTLESIGDAVITTDRNGDITWMNPAAERMTGWSSVEAGGRPLPQVFHVIHEETRETALNTVASALEQGIVVSLSDRTTLVSRDGVEFGIEESAAPIRDGSGQLKGVVLVFHDVTEQRRLSGEMNYRATHDPLTELLNRSEFEARLRRLIHTTHQDGAEHALLFIDLDQFKLVNDACGHAVGDQLLQQVAKLLGQAVRGRDTLARLGGDEFAVILEHCSAEQAQRVAREICDRVDDFRFVHGERRFRIGASIGLVPVDQRWTTIEALVQAADSACYAAKDGGRNRVHIWFDTDQAIRMRSGEAHWATRLATALDEDLFELHAQRIFAVRGETTGVHAEVLLRLREADGELVLPGAFLPAAERFHLMTRIDRWVLDKTLHWLAHARNPDRILNLSINLSSQSIGDRAFHQHAIERLREAGPSICRKISFEITETAAITNLADATVFIENVQRLGVRIALDDFGAGASSFAYLKNLPVDTLKIDGQFVRDVATDALDAAAMRCFSDVARVVGVHSVAENVETEAALDQLVSLQVDFAQGFLLHRPAPMAELDESPATSCVGAGTARAPN